MIAGSAIILTGSAFDHVSAKTAHGLVRGSERFQIKAIIDSKSAGKDAGTVLDGKPRDIPVLSDLDAFLDRFPESANYCILGIANAGGSLPRELFPLVRQAIKAGISIVSGMHEFLSNQPELVELAQTHKVELIDVRKPKGRHELSFWSGRIKKVACPKIGVLGTDCAVGKRTTAHLMVQRARAQGRNAQMVFTGQTGWMQSGKYGFILDSTVNDFVSGELEQAIFNCYEAENPDFILVEGQAALRNPSGPCGSEYLVSGQMDGVILVHPPGRIYHKGWDHLDFKIAPVKDEIALIKMYGVKTLGLALNTSGLSLEAAQDFRSQYEEELGIPVVLPIEEGVDRLLALI